MKKLSLQLKKIKIKIKIIPASVTYFTYIDRVLQGEGS